MNYSKIYEALMSRSKNRELGVYSEQHHILPKCLGGTNEKSNLVALTPEEHFLAHQLLVKMHPNNSALVKAAHMMTVGNNASRNNNKKFGWLRRRMSEAMSEMAKNRTYSEETRSKMSAAKLGNSNSKGQVVSEERRLSISKQFKGIPKSEEHKRKIGIGNVGKKRSFEHMSKAAKASHKVKKTCPVCGKITSCPNFQRHMRTHTSYSNTHLSNLQMG